MPVNKSKDDLIPPLFRYFMAASLMSEEFYKRLQENETSQADPMLFFITKGGIKMCLWYGMLFVAIEGWQEIGLSDPVIDSLLRSPNVALLKRFRNGMFHFQKGWLDLKLTDFCGAPDAVEWVNTLAKELRRYLLAEMARISAKPGSPAGE